MAQPVGTPKSAFNLNQQGVLIRRANLDGAIQLIALKSLRGHILRLTNHPLLAGRPGGRWMYETLRRHVFWPHIAADVYSTLKTCQRCPKMQTKFAHQRQLEQFPANRSLKIIAIDILGPLPRTKEGMRYVVFMTDRYTILTRAIQTATVTSTETAKIFVKQWVMPYEIPKTVLAGNRQQVVSKFLLHFV